MTKWPGVLGELWGLVEELFMIEKPSDWLKYLALFAALGIYAALGGV